VRKPQQILDMINQAQPPFSVLFTLAELHEEATDLIPVEGLKDRKAVSGYQLYSLGKSGFHLLI